MQVADGQTLEGIPDAEFDIVTCNFSMYCITSRILWRECSPRFVCSSPEDACLLLFVGFQPPTRLFKQLRARESAHPTRHGVSSGPQGNQVHVCISQEGGTEWGGLFLMRFFPAPETRKQTNKTINHFGIHQLRFTCISFGASSS